MYLPVQLFFTDLLVDLRGGDRGVAEQLLHRAQVRTVGEHVLGERMAQRVRRQIVGAKLRGVAFEDQPKALARQALPAMVEKQRAVGLA